MKSLVLILAILCLAFSIFAQQSSGPIVNTADVSIEADSDASNDGKVVFKTKGVTQAVFGNDGKLGIQTDNPTALIDINPPAIGPHEIINVRSNEPGGGNFRLNYYSTPNIFTDPGGLLTGRTLKSFQWGHNPPGTANYNPDDSSLFYNTEIGYVTAAGRPQDEWWLGSRAPGYAFTRPLSIDLYRDNGQTQIALSTPRVIVRDTDAVVHNLWLEFLSSPTSGTMTLYGNSEISFAGTKKYFMSHMGIGIIGRDLASSRVWNLIKGGAQNETLHIFESDQIANGPLAIKLGQDGIGFTVGSSPKGIYRMQGTGEFPGLSDVMYAADVDVASTANKTVQRDSNGAINVSAIKIDGVAVLDGQCAAILNPEINERVNNVTIMAILTCLRQVKIVAQ